MSHAQPPPTAAAAAAEPATTAGPAADEPPPLTAFAWRNRLVRPVRGRLFAGVCGAIGRATNTDPVLWRVLLAVLSIFGGIGVLLYLLGWLLLPADGDTASPIEALIGRGHSETSPALTVIGAVVVLLALGVFFSEPFQPGPWGVILLGAAVLLLLRDRRGRARPEPAGLSASGAPRWPAAEPPPAAPLAASAPFAPRGPYAAATATYPGLASSPDATLPPSPPPSWAAPPLPAPPPPPPPRSRLGRLTFSVLLLALGGLAVLDLSGISVPAGGYLAAALAVVGGGLVLGTWVGRARGLIALGILLSLVLGLTGLAGTAESRPWRGGVGEIFWRPDSLAQLRDGYRHGVGDARLDLSSVNFGTATGPVRVSVRLHVGSLEIIVPPEVDVTVVAHVDGGGNADVFAESWNGLGLDPRTVTDLDRDGPGGGELHITATVAIGNLEVRR